MVSVIRGAGKIPLPGRTSIESSPPERLIADIGAGVTFWFGAGDCGCRVGGFGAMSLKK